MTAGCPCRSSTTNKVVAVATFSQHCSSMAAQEAQAGAAAGPGHKAAGAAQTWLRLAAYWCQIQACTPGAATSGGSACAHQGYRSRSVVCQRALVLHLCHHDEALYTSRDAFGRLVISVGMLNAAGGVQPLNGQRPACWGLSDTPNQLHGVRRPCCAHLSGALQIGCTPPARAGRARPSAHALAGQPDKGLAF